MRQFADDSSKIDLVVQRRNPGYHTQARKHRKKIESEQRRGLLGIARAFYLTWHYSTAGLISVELLARECKLNFETKWNFKQLLKMK